MKKNSAIFTLLLGCLLTGCLSETPLPTVTPLPPTEMPVQTPTPVWFPVTETPTPPPTPQAQPTEDRIGVLGDVILAEDFEDGINWSLIQTVTGSAAVANNHLTLVLNRPKSLLLTTRYQPTFYDFYLEITANPNLCQGQDEYGLLIRAGADGDTYRFGVSCNGQAHVDRIYQSVPRSMAPWTFSPAIPTTSPSTVKLAVRAEGSELRFFANGQYLFTVRDTVLYGGTIGLYVRTTGDNAISVNFSDLNVYALVGE